MGENLDDFMETVGYSKQISESREAMIFPHELSMLNDVLLITPYGFCRVEKIQLHNNTPNQMMLPVYKTIPATAEIAAPSSEQEALPHENEMGVPDWKSGIIYCRAMTLEEALEEEILKKESLKC